LGDVDPNHTPAKRLKKSSKKAEKARAHCVCETAFCKAKGMQPKRFMVRLCKPKISLANPNAAGMPRAWLEALGLEEEKIVSVLSQHNAFSYGASNTFISNSHFHHTMFNWDNDFVLRLNKTGVPRVDPQKWISPYPRHKPLVEKLGLKFEEETCGPSSPAQTPEPEGTPTPPPPPPPPPSTPPPSPRPLTTEEQLEAHLRAVTERSHDQVHANMELQASLKDTIFKLESCQQKIAELEDQIQVLLKGSFMSYERLKSDKRLQAICGKLTPFPTGKCEVTCFT
jgi:hypothetical protein